MPLDPLTSSAIIGGAASLVSGAGQAVVGAKLNKKNRKFYQEMTENQNAFNAEQAQIAYQRSKDLYDYQFDKESAYNSPLAQMQRMRAAGLNPALLYGSGVGDAGSVSASPSGVGAATAASPSPPQMTDFFSPSIQSAMNVASTLSKIGVNKSQRKNLDANTDLTKDNSKKVQKETQTLVYTLEKMLPVQYQGAIADVRKTLSDMNVSQRVSTAQIAELQAKVKDILANVQLKGHQDQKLVAELNKYQEYIDNVYEREKYRHDIEKTDFEYLDMTKGLKNKIMQGLRAPNHNFEETLQNMLLYLMTKLMNF